MDSVNLNSNQRNHYINPKIADQQKTQCLNEILWGVRLWGETPSLPKFFFNLMECDIKSEYYLNADRVCKHPFNWAWSREDCEDITSQNLIAPMTYDWLSKSLTELDPFFSLEKCRSVGGKLIFACPAKNGGDILLLSPTLDSPMVELASENSRWQCANEKNEISGEIASCQSEHVLAATKHTLKYNLIFKGDVEKQQFEETTQKITECSSSICDIGSDFWDPLDIQEMQTNPNSHLWKSQKNTSFPSLFRNANAFQKPIDLSTVDGLYPVYLDATRSYLHHSIHNKLSCQESSGSIPTSANPESISYAGTCIDSTQNQNTQWIIVGIAIGIATFAVLQAISNSYSRQKSKKIQSNIIDREKQTRPSLTYGLHASNPDEYTKPATSQVGRVGYKTTKNIT